MTTWDYYWQTYPVIPLVLQGGGFGIPHDSFEAMARLGADGWELVSMSLAPLVTGGGGSGSGGPGGMSIAPIWVDVQQMVALAVFKRPRAA
jgi:hypothetical protein